MAEEFVPNKYVYRHFIEAQHFIDDSSDPLSKGLIGAIELIHGKLRPDSDLPAELAARCERWLADANSAKAKQPGYSLTATTIRTRRNKERWRLASELLHLRYAFRLLLPPEVADEIDQELARRLATKRSRGSRRTAVEKVESAGSTEQADN